jgi:hypothetical protein
MRWLLFSALAACSGHSTPADGGAPDLGPVVEDCHAMLPAPASGACSLTAGGKNLLLEGDVLAPDRVIHGGQVAVDANGNITCVACDCSAQAAGATTIACPHAVLSPGLINLHDHLDYAQNAPVDHGAERYDHRDEWRLGLDGHTKLDVSAASAQNPVIAFAELRQVMGGETSIVAVGSVAGMLRNLDYGDPLQGGLGRKAIVFDTFPLGDTGGEMLTSGCGYPMIRPSSTVGPSPFEPHISEGVNAAAHNELGCLSSTANGGQDDVIGLTGIIHAVAIGAQDAQGIASAGANVIWSPRSNLSLYGNTTPVTLLDALAVPVSLATDWSASGSIHLARELVCADQFNQAQLGGHFSDEDLWKMVTAVPARAAHVDDALGSLAPGKIADVAIFDASTRAAYRAPIGATPADVLLVLRGGQALYGDDALVAALSPMGCESMMVCGAAKRLCSQREFGSTVAQLSQLAATPIYGLYFCGTPDGEPTCVPSRPNEYSGVPSSSDADGDGVPDAMDDCPHVFDPARPMDAGKQPDADGDGAGDLCDAAPLDPTRK